jgi:hypothetical protein
MKDEGRPEARYTSASEHVEWLTPSRLAKAFRRELVERDLNDESAGEEELRPFFGRSLMPSVLDRAFKGEL